MKLILVNILSLKNSDKNLSFNCSSLDIALENYDKLYNQQKIGVNSPDYVSNFIKKYCKLTYSLIKNYNLLSIKKI
jgi:hypothetical protein